MSAYGVRGVVMDLVRFDFLKFGLFSFGGTYEKYDYSAELRYGFGNVYELTLTLLPERSSRSFLFENLSVLGGRNSGRSDVWTE